MSWSFRGVLRLERFRYVQSWLCECVCVCVCLCVGGKGGMLTCLRRCRGWWWGSRAPEWWPTVWIGYCPWSCLGGGHPQGSTTAHISIYKHVQTRFKWPWAKESNKASPTSLPVDMTATTGNFCTSTSVTPTVAKRPISDGPMWVPLANTHSPRLISWPIGLCVTQASD